MDMGAQVDGGLQMREKCSFLWSKSLQVSSPKPTATLSENPTLLGKDRSWKAMISNEALH